MLELSERMKRGTGRSSRVGSRTLTARGDIIKSMITLYNTARLMGLKVYI